MEIKAKEKFEMPNPRTDEMKQTRTTEKLEAELRNSITLALATNEILKKLFERSETPCQRKS